ncbi:MAG: hypothetical protein V3U07_03695 [Nitrospirales bacterium]|jgi:hypothetical protein
MTDSTLRPEVPAWLYKLFTGHQYPYVRRQAKFDRKDRQSREERTEPTLDEIREKFWEIFPRCTTKMLQEVKTGMIVAFKELGGYAAGTYQEFIDHPEEFLAREYGKKKIKVNFYDGDNFVCTINFKVAGWASHDDD